MAVVNLLLAPFVLVFLLIYFFMRNAEKFYHQPSSAGSRRWSSLAAWRLREFNELPHYLNHRCALTLSPTFSKGESLMHWCCSNLACMAPLAPGLARVAHVGCVCVVASLLSSGILHIVSCSLDPGLSRLPLLGKKEQS